MHYFLQNFANHMRKSEDYVIADTPREVLGKFQIPGMALLLQNKVTQNDLILSHIECGLPVVVA